MRGPRFRVTHDPPRGRIIFCCAPDTRYSAAVSASKSPDAQRIAKLLARAGIASRREIERMIAEGRIALNGETLTTPATLLTSLHGVTVDGTPVREPAPARLFLYHKPVGLLTAAYDPAGRPTIYDRLPQDLPRLMPVGRLDRNTEGLLLMTTDGELKRQLELPATGVERSYRARALGSISQEQLEGLIDGIEIDGMRYGSIDANLERRTGANVWIEMTLTEGKNREVRRVLEYFGLQVSRLIRTRYGPFVLGELPVGEIGEVRQHDLITFRKSLTLPPAQRANLTIQMRTEGAAARPRPARPPREEDGREPDAPRRAVKGAAALGPKRSGKPSRAPQKSPSPSGAGFGAGAVHKRSARGESPTPTPPLKGRGLKGPNSKTGSRTRDERPSREDGANPRRTGRPPRDGEPRPPRAAVATGKPGTRPGRPPRDTEQRPPREDVANPRRAERARTHRETSEPREGDLVERPRPTGPRPPRGGRPNKRPARPQRTRK